MEEAIDNNDPHQFFLSMHVHLKKTLNDKESLQRIKDFLPKVLNSATDKLRTLNAEQSSELKSDFGMLLKLADVSIVEPRGKYDILLRSQGIEVIGKGISSFSDYKNICNFFCLDSAECQKPDKERLIVILFKESIRLGNKDVTNLVLRSNQLQDDGMRKERSISNEGSVILNSFWKIIFEKLQGIKIIYPNPALFQTTKSRLYLKCNKGTQDGSLFFLGNGILFLRPFFFIPIHCITSISAGRGGNCTNTSYIDLTVRNLAIG